MARKIEYNCTLERRVDVTDALTIFRFVPDTELPAGPWFVPGQYLVIGLNNERAPELGSVQRPMSIASSAHDRAGIEFYIRYVKYPVSKNPLTHLLWQLAEGDRAYVRPVGKGHFTVEHIAKNDPRLKVFVAAGTGLAPFLSIVRSELDRDPEASLSEYAILHGASYPEDLGYREEIERLVEKHGLRYVPTISRPQEAHDWQDATGRVEDLFRPDRIADTEARLRLDAGALTPQAAVVLVCGLQGTIGKSIQNLASRGFVPDHRGMRQAFDVPESVPAALFYEQYDNEPAIDLKDAQLVERLRVALSSALG